MENNLIYFGCWDELEIGSIVTVGLKKPGGELQRIPVKIVREATKEEYLDYCESINIALRTEVETWIELNKKTYHPQWGAHYYAGHGD